MYAMCARHNLGSKARRSHLRAGVILAGVTLALGFVLSASGLPRALDWLLVLPVMLTSYAMLAGLFGACVYSGARGIRQADHGFEAVPDDAQRQKLRQRGLALALASVAIAVVSTGIFVASV